MSSQALENDLDPTPLVKSIVEKTKAGKLRWEATINENVFIASVGGNTTLRISLETTEGFQPETGQYGPMEVHVLRLLDDQGKTLWEMRGGKVAGGLRPLFELARRIGNKLDERMEALIGALERL